MAFYLISYDTHNTRNYDSLYSGMDKKGGVPLLESLWGIEFSNTVTEVRTWVVSLLDEDDSIMVVPFNPGGGYATQELNKKALAWLTLANKG